MHIQDIDLSKLPAGVKQTGWLDVAPRPDGSTWRLPFLYITGDKPGPRLIVTSGVHGDEYEGVEAIPQVFHQTDSQSLSGTLFMIPVCNMPAFETITRSSPIDGLNLARVFPGDPTGSITQRIADLIATKILPNADFYIDLHSGGMMYDIPTLAGYIHHQSELGTKSLAGAQAFGAPVLWGHPFPISPGRTLSSAVELGVPVRENLPITIVHISNGGFAGYGPGFWGEGHDPYTHKVMGHDEVNMPRAIAEFGYHTERIEDPDQVAEALKRALSANDNGQSAYLEFICSQFPIYGDWAR